MNGPPRASSDILSSDSHRLGVLGKHRSSYATSRMLCYALLYKQAWWKKRHVQKQPEQVPHRHMHKKNNYTQIYTPATKRAIRPSPRLSHTYDCRIMNTHSNLFLQVRLVLYIHGFIATSRVSRYTTRIDHNHVVDLRSICSRKQYCT